MLLDDVWTLLETRVFPKPSSDTLFNPYHTTHATLDRPDAAQTRRGHRSFCWPRRPARGAAASRASRS